MSDTHDSEVFRKAYEQTEFRMERVGAGDRYEIPTAKPALFRYEGDVENAARVTSAFGGEGFALISPYTEEKVDSFFVSTKGLCSETNEFFHLKMTANTVRIFPKDEDFSEETLVAVAEQLEKELDIMLTLVEDDDDSG